METDVIEYEIPDPVEVATTAVSQNGEQPKENIVTMSTGVQFRIKPIPKMAMGGITERFNRDKPKIPLVFVESKGRKEPNPDHPDYQEALRDWQLSLTMALQNVLFLRGLELLEDSIPADMVRYTDPDWAYEAEMYATNITNPKALYLAWVQYIAAPIDEDVAVLIAAVSRRSGINQEDVQDAIDRFQR